MLIGQEYFKEADSLLWTSFSISIISAAFGIAKLLKNGPIKMIRKDGKIGGYGTPGFVLLMVAVAGNMIGKASWVAWAFAYANKKSAFVCIWALTCILPQLLLVKSQNNVYLKKYVLKRILSFSDHHYLAYQFWSQNYFPIH